MSRASDAYSELTRALDEIAPACKNDARFIADDQKTEELAPICRTCPVFAECAAYGNLARPKAAVWGGVRYRTNNPRKTAEMGGIA